MTINATASILLCPVHRGGREARACRPTKLSGHRAERHPEGIHRPRHLHLPADAVHAADHRHVRLLPRARPALEHDLDLRLSHPRGGVAPPPRKSRSPWPTASRTSQRARDAGQDVDDFAPQLSFFFNAHNNLLEEVAKFRAARRMWARIMRERFKARRPALPDAALSHPDGGLARSPPSSRRTTSSASPSRRSPRSSAAASRSTPTRWTRRSRCPARRPCASRCAPSRCSPTSPESPIPWTRSEAPTPSSG